MEPDSNLNFSELMSKLTTVPLLVSVVLILTLVRLFLLSRKTTLFPGGPRQIHPTARGFANAVGVLLCLFVVGFLLPRPFLPQLFYIPSEAMEPTLLGHEPGHNMITGVEHTDSVHDHIVVNKFIYRLGNPQRGDIIVFKAPPEADGEDKNLGLPLKENILVKRCMAIPGDTIWIHDGAIWRKEPGQKDFTRLVEPYLDPKQPLEDPQRPDAAFGVSEPLLLPPDRYYVMGDNRNDSNDSRFWGTLERKRIIGKAVSIYAPADRARALR